MTEWLFVFCYDISKRRTRARVARRLEDHALRVQGSVFEARMTPRRARALGRALEAELDPGDSLKVYAVGQKGRAHSMAFGAALPPHEGHYVLL